MFSSFHTICREFSFSVSCNSSANIAEASKLLKGVGFEMLNLCTSAGLRSVCCKQTADLRDDERIVVLNNWVCCLNGREQCRTAGTTTNSVIRNSNWG